MESVSTELVTTESVTTEISNYGFHSYGSHRYSQVAMFKKGQSRKCLCSRAVHSRETLTHYANLPLILFSLLNLEGQKRAGCNDCQKEETAGIYLETGNAITVMTWDTSQKFGNPKIGDKNSAHQARFPSSPINRLPNLVFSDYRQIRIIRTHRKSSELPNLVIRVTRITKYSVIWLFGELQENPKTLNLPHSDP
jgi:hypothetical protein